MERIIKAQTMSDTKSMAMMSMKTLEVNPRHPIVHELNKRVRSMYLCDSIYLHSRILNARGRCIL